MTNGSQISNFETHENRDQISPFLVQIVSKMLLALLESWKCILH